MMLQSRSNVILATLACLMIFMQVTDGMICYRCTVLPAQYVGEANQPCSKFDGGSSYYQDCPKSTFCMKRIIHYKLSNGSMVTTAERDCAPQKYTFQDYSDNDKKWYSRESIDKEAYKDGCFKGENRGAPNGPSEYCFCSRNYCNDSTTIQISSLLVIILIMFLRFT